MLYLRPLGHILLFVVVLHVPSGRAALRRTRFNDLPKTIHNESRGPVTQLAQCSVHDDKDGGICLQLFLRKLVVGESLGGKRTAAEIYCYCYSGMALQNCGGRLFSSKQCRIQGILPRTLHVNTEYQKHTTLSPKP